MIDVITATIAAVMGLGALVCLMLWAQSQRGRVVRRESCVCTPSRGMRLTEVTTHPAIVEVSQVRRRTGSANLPQVDTEAIDVMLERHRHEMAAAIENERHYSELQRIRNQQHAPKPQTRLPQPVRRTVPRLPAPSVVEIPGETVTTDGYRWVALEREVSEVSE